MDEGRGRSALLPSPWPGAATGDLLALDSPGGCECVVSPYRPSGHAYCTFSQLSRTHPWSRRKSSSPEEATPRHEAIRGTFSLTFNRTLVGHPPGATRAVRCLYSGKSAFPLSGFPLWFGVSVLQEQQPFLTPSLLLQAWGWGPCDQSG